MSVPNTQPLRRFLYVDGDCNIEVELWVQARTRKEAGNLAWSMLTPEQQDAIGCLECIDEAAL